MYVRPNACIELEDRRPKVVSNLTTLTQTISGCWSAIWRRLPLPQTARQLQIAMASLRALELVKLSDLVIGLTMQYIQSIVIECSIFIVTLIIRLNWIFLTYSNVFRTVNLYHQHGQPSVELGSHARCILNMALSVVLHSKNATKNIVQS